ncbi:MAG TPA: ABC transporter permease, partial [Lachnospiraceae bacterium]|nr:ABC transporter permease [Lachnospiraceae bacterium]
MQRVLRKRVLRDLKANFLRYLALGLMVVMGMFIVVSIVGSAETLTNGTKKLAEETNLEDGEFSVFVPLTKAEIEEIKKMDIALEEQFYLDYIRDDEDKSTVRIFKVRKNINQIKYIEGNAPSAEGEIVVEKRYSEEHSIKVGDSFDIAGVNYKVSGIGCVSDYDGPYKNISDTSCNSKYFGLVFMTENDYEAFRKSGKSQKSEEFAYAYKLGSATDK